MTSRISRLAPRLLATLALALGAGGCAKGEQALHPPALLEARTSQFESSVAGTLDAAVAVTSALGIIRGRCLATHGFPQVDKALSLRRAASPDFDQGLLDIAPIEFGPSTEDEARKYGMVGTEVATDTGDVGVVVANDPDFDRASERCDEWIYTKLSPGLREVQSDAAEFQDAVRLDFVSLLAADVKAVMAARARCVIGAGYPRLTEAAFFDAPSMEALLHAAGVEPGRVDVPATSVPARQEVPVGTVLVYPPPSSVHYSPSEDEVAFAVAYARCGKVVGFGKASARAEATARETVEARRAAESDDLRQDLLAGLENLHVSAATTEQ